MMTLLTVTSPNCQLKISNFMITAVFPVFWGVVNDEVMLTAVGLMLLSSHPAVSWQVQTVLSHCCCLYGTVVQHVFSVLSCLVCHCHSVRPTGHILLTEYKLCKFNHFNCILYYFVLLSLLFWHFRWCGRMWETSVWRWLWSSGL